MDEKLNKILKETGFEDALKQLNAILEPTTKTNEIKSETNVKQDRLRDLFVKQIEFQYKVGNFPLNIEKQKYITEQALALIVETTESLQETPWKSWKQSATFNEDKFKEEIIDCWHFLINLTISVMRDEEFYLRFMKKNAENIKRQDDGY